MHTFEFSLESDARNSEEKGKKGGGGSFVYCGLVVRPFHGWEKYGEGE